MPDLSQEQETCLPTSTANLIIWFAHHGYPKLLQSGDTEDERELHTVHVLMNDTDATYQMGTRTEAITYGIDKYIRDAGYSCDVEYRGVDWSQAKFPNNIVKDDEEEKYKPFEKTPVSFSTDWLQQNDDPEKGFILLLSFVKFDRSSNTFSNAYHAGHAVTLVNAESDMLLVHDPAHRNDQPGRKILTPEELTGGDFEMEGFRAPASGLLLLTGSLMRGPRDGGILLTGAVCITMHPDNQSGSVIASAGASPTTTVGGTNGATSSAPVPDAPAAPAIPATSSTTWAEWIFDTLFKK